MNAIKAPRISSGNWIVDAVMQVPAVVREIQNNARIYDAMNNFERARFEAAYIEHEHAQVLTPGIGRDFIIREPKRVLLERELREKRLMK